MLSVTKSKTYKEWTLDMPWGNIAMASWGNPAKPPVLMVHGYLDSCATFNRLVDELPDLYYYVAFDFPGHGKSDPFPPGLVISHVYYIEIIRAVVQHLKWEKFFYISHSLGFFIGAYYNNVFPGRISKMVNIDPSPTFPLYYFTSNDPKQWAQLFYDDYYNNYISRNYDEPKFYTYNEAILAVAKARNLTTEQAEVVLSRCLVPVTKELYRLSWEPRVKRPAGALICAETLFNILTTNAPPMLNVLAATRDITYTPDAEEFGKKIIERIRNTIAVSEVTVTGGHDLHITNPAALVPHIVKFLEVPLPVATTVTKAKL